MNALRISVLLCVAVLLLAHPALAADKSQVMTGEVLALWPEGAPLATSAEGDAHVPVVYKYLPKQPNGTAIVVCPGGGYGGLAFDHEGEQVAQWLNANGIAAFVLRYRHAPLYQHPVPRVDVQRAIRTVRHNAKDWGVNPERIGVLGFSAGGHLTATAATQFRAEDLKAGDAIDKESARPDFAAPIYPVITMRERWGHMGSRNNLLGPEPTQALMDEMSMESQVTKETPPIFIAFTTEDQAVPVKNGLAFYEACVTSGVPVEMHLFEKGRHGLGLGVEDLPFKQWPDLFLAWLKNRGLI